MKADKPDLKKAAELRAKGYPVYLGPRGTMEEGQAYFHKLQTDFDVRCYPRWLYKDGGDPILAHNETEWNEAVKNGYDEPWALSISNKQLQNWYWDLEDMSARQLSVFASEEYGVDLPMEAGQERLLKAIIHLAKFAPQNQGRLTLMAHTIHFELDETIEEIKRQVENASEVERKVVYL